jgi:hypothetical protein
VLLVVGVVDDGSHAADGLAALPGEESLNFRVVVKGMGSVVHQFLLVLAEGWDPVGIGGVNLPGELEEGRSFAAGFDGLDDDGSHGHPCWVSKGIGPARENDRIRGSLAGRDDDRGRKFQIARKIALVKTGQIAMIADTSPGRDGGAVPHRREIRCVRHKAAPVV